MRASDGSPDLSLPRFPEQDLELRVGVLLEIPFSQLPSPKSRLPPPQSSISTGLRQHTIPEFPVGMHQNAIACISSFRASTKRETQDQPFHFLRSTHIPPGGTCRLTSCGARPPQRICTASFLHNKPAISLVYSPPHDRRATAFAPPPCITKSSKGQFHPMRAEAQSIRSHSFKFWTPNS
jgi:hypothetical protein